MHFQEEDFQQTTIYDVYLLTREGKALGKAHLQMLG